MRTITFDVEGNPKGQPRPRAFSRGGHARVYDPGTAEGWKSCIALAARPHLPSTPIAGAVSVDLAFWFARPKGHTGKKGLKPSAPPDHTQKPDLDNLAKAVLDCLTEIGMWVDDAQIVGLTLRKVWLSEPGSGCVVTIVECANPVENVGS